MFRDPKPDVPLIYLVWQLSQSSNIFIADRSFEAQPTNKTLARRCMSIFNSFKLSCHH